MSTVGFGDEYSCDHIDIPQGVSYSYVSLLPHVRVVSAATVATLLCQIAGLTSIAMEHSLKARDEMLRLKREHKFQIEGDDRVSDCCGATSTVLLEFTPACPETSMQKSKLGG